MKSLRKIQVKWILYGLFLFLFLFLTVCISYLLAYSRTIIPGVFVQGIPLGNKTVEEATTQLEQLSLDSRTSFEFVGEGKIATYSVEPLLFAFSPSKTAQSAYQMGRGIHLTQNVLTQWTAWWKGKEVERVFTYDQEALSTLVTTISQEWNVPPHDAAFRLEGGKVVITEGSLGKIVNETILATLLLERLKGAPSSIPIPLEMVSPRIQKTHLAPFSENITQLVQKSLVLVFQNKKWELKPQDLLPFYQVEDTSASSIQLTLSVGKRNFRATYKKPQPSIQSSSFALGVDETVLQEYIDSLNTEIQKPPQDAVFQIENDRVTVFQPSKDGISLDREHTYQAVQQSLLSSNREPITLTLLTSPPSIQTEDVNNLGIQTLLGRGVSYFRGSLAGREFNIAHGAAKLNGILIPPEATFSFNEALGDVSTQTGFQPAYVIKDGKTDWGIGGGVCQISTTVFRAALYSGLPVLERHAHSYRVHYYEEGTPVGLDASVFAPSWDLKFVNDTPGHILIQSSVDLKTKTLVFEFYGTPDGRTTTVSNSVITKTTPSPEPLYVDDPNLPVGQTKQLDWAVAGADVQVKRQVARSEQILIDETIFSHYVPWKAIYARGTKPL